MTTHVPKILGTVADVSVGGVSGRRAAKLEQRVIDEIRRLESVFNLFDPMSAINTLRTQGHSDVSELNSVLALAEQWHITTAGAFNPYTNGLRSLWTDAARNQLTPPDATLAAEAADIAGATKPIRHLNLNAIAKGWIVDRAVESTLHIKRPPENCWVSIGGDVAHRGAGSITVGIEDPFRPFDNADPLATVALSNAALATSGGARRSWTIGDERFSHVIDPRTGRPVDHVASATAIAADAVSADVLATAATVLQVSESLKLIDSTPGAACLIVSSDRAIHRSSSWLDAPLHG